MKARPPLPTYGLRCAHRHEVASSSLPGLGMIGTKCHRCPCPLDTFVVHQGHATRVSVPDYGGFARWRAERRKRRH